MYKSVFDEPVAEGPDESKRTDSMLRIVLTSIVAVIALAASAFGGYYYATYQTAISSVNEIKADLERIERKVNDISSSSECDLDGVETRLDEVESVIKGVGMDLSEVASDVTSMKSDVASMEINVSSIQLRLGY